MRRYSSRSSKKRATRWFASSNGYMDPGVAITQSTTNLVPFAMLLAMHPRSPALVTADLVQDIADDTILTVRGQILITGDPDIACLAHMGIRIATLEPVGTAPNFGPHTADEANDDWMWLHHTIVPNYATQGTGWLSSQTIDVHVKSKRVLRDNEALVLYGFTTRIVSANDDAQLVQFYPYLRTLVTKAA